MLNKHNMVLLLCSILFSHSFTASAKKKAPDSKKPAIVRHYILQGGFQYGTGIPLSNKSSGDLNLKNSFSHNVNMYLKLRLKSISIYGGMQSTNLMLDKNILEQSYIDNYSKNGYDVVTYADGNSSKIIVPYLGVSYHFTQNKFEIEPFIRLGIGFQNYYLSGFTLESNSIAQENIRFAFFDQESSSFIRPSLGINASTKILNIVRLKASLVYEGGNNERNEIKEFTMQGDSYIRKRNIFLQNSANQFCIMIGFEITPYNRISLYEKKYQKWLQKQGHLN